MFAELREVRVAREPGEIPVAEVDGPLQRLHRLLELPGERATAREVIVDQRVTGAQPDELLVHFEAVNEPPALRVVIAEELQRLHVLRIAADDAFEKTNLDVQIALLRARECFP